MLFPPPKSFKTLSWFFFSLNMICLGISFSFWFHFDFAFMLLHVLWISYICGLLFYINFGKFPIIIASNVSSDSFSLSSSSGISFTCRYSFCKCTELFGCCCFFLLYISILEVPADILLRSLSFYVAVSNLSMSLSKTLFLLQCFLFFRISFGFSQNFHLCFITSLFFHVVYFSPLKPSAYWS